jgi:hypothetical protein
MGSSKAIGVVGCDLIKYNLKWVKKNRKGKKEEKKGGRSDRRLLLAPFFETQAEKD